MTPVLVTTAPALAVGLVGAKIPGRFSAWVVLVGALWYGLGMVAFVASGRVNVDALEVGVYGWVASLVAVSLYWLVWASVRCYWRYRSMVAGGPGGLR
jgi:hypothetical protein